MKMNQNGFSTMQREYDATKKPGLLEYFFILGRWKKFIIRNVLIITVLAAIVSFILPKTYRASSTILPPKNTNIFSAIGLSSSTLMRQFSPFRALSGSLSPDLYTYVAILKSRGLLLRVINEFDLMNIYETEFVDDAIGTLKSNTDYTVQEEGTIRIEVYDHDAERAYRMSKFIVYILDSLNRDLTVREAATNRAFIQNRVNQNVIDLMRSEEELKSFQEKNGMIALSSEVSASINAVAELYSQKVLKEFEVGYLTRALGPQNPQLEAASMQLAEINKHLKDVPDKGMLFTRLYREYMVQQKLYETLLPILEQAKIEEQKNTPTLLVLDAASVPERPIKPQKKIIVIVFFFLSLVFSFATAIITERIKNFAARQPNEYEKIARMFRPLGKILPINKS